MESKELRLGNLFIEENSNKIIEVIGLEKNRVVFSGMFVDKWQAKPIPLIEEWLLKFGFEKSKRFELGELKPCYVIFSLAVMIRHNSFFVDWIGGNTELKYVHQLQNLYFALTGADLTVA